MKKSDRMGFFKPCSLNLNLSMKLTALLLLVSIFSIEASVYSQKNEVTLDLERVETRKVLETIESLTDLKFFYNNKKIDADRLVSVKVVDRPVSEVLDIVFQGTSIYYILRERQVILKLGAAQKPSSKDSGDRSSGIDENVVQQSVSGTVTDAKGVPLPGANILEKGTTNGVQSDFDGKFSLTISSEDAVLSFSYLGFVTQEIAVEGRTTLDVVLAENAALLNEVVVVGYGTQTVKELTGAVSQVKAEALEKIATSDFTSALQGQMAGVNVVQSSGAPGSNANVQIRGVGSLLASGTGPLYVVDGVPYEQTPNISNDAIQSIEVLKDAASASIYGTRASNGVILITTKKGTPGQMKVNLDSYYGITKIRRNIPLINNTADWLYVNRIRYVSVNEPGDFGWTALQPGWHHRGLYYNTNWTELFQVDNAPIQNHSVRLSGGTENLTYSVVTSYFNQKGLWLNSAYERLSTRANTHFEKGRFSANVGVDLAYDVRDISHPELPISAITLRPFTTPLNNWNEEEAFPLPESNPSQSTDLYSRLKRTNTAEGNNHSINMDLNYEVFDGFTLRTNLGGFQKNTYTKLFEPRFTYFDEFTGEPAPGGVPIASLEVGQNFRQHWISEFMAMYKESFGNHNISALAAYSREQTTRRSFLTGRRDFLSNDVQVLSGGAIDPSSSGTEYVSSLTGSIGRLQYNFAERYLLSASVRRDGSSRFGEDDRYGIFPSFSAGWNIDEEPFYENLGISSTLTSAKIRASYGTTGNQFIPDYLFAPLVNAGVDYVLGEPDQQLALGVTQNDFADLNVKWETSIAQNIGLDLQFLDGDLTFTGDAYITKKSDMLFPVAVPPSAGSGESGEIILNVGNMTNKGFELASTYRNFGDEFDFSLTGTFSRNVNEVTQTNLASSTIFGGGGVSVIKEGLPAGAFLLIPTDGLITSETELADYQNLDSGAELGDLKYVDVNGDETINDDDRLYMGNGSPKWTAGFNINANYRNFDFFTQLYGSYGNMIYNNIKRIAYQNKRHLEVLNAWTPANSTSTIPTPRGSGSHPNVRPRSDYFLEDAGYLRIRSIQLGYNFSEILMNNLAIGNCRVYVGVENLFTFTKYTGNDPEVGNDGLLNRGVDSGNIPVTSQFRAGLQLEF